MACEWKDKIFSVTDTGFEALALEIFRYQYHENEVYRLFATALGRNAKNVTSIQDIPFLPVSFYKSFSVVSGLFEPQMIFESSGTTNIGNSKHFVKDTGLYETSFISAFQQFYGNISDYCVVGLLPSYLERNNSSLVYMVNDIIKKSGHAESGFYLYDHKKLFEVLGLLELSGRKTILIGVTFALLDFASNYSLPLKNTIIIETGGMKGRREELIREDVHRLLCSAFGLPVIHSEYGMTELLSQAYSKGNGVFNSPAWMKILLRDEEDPLTIKSGFNQSGIINIIDLANIYSCSFIATDDAGKLHQGGSFEVLGRIDGSDLRGCSLMTG